MSEAMPHDAGRRDEERWRVMGSAVQQLVVLRLIESGWVLDGPGDSACPSAWTARMLVPGTAHAIEVLQSGEIIGVAGGSLSGSVGLFSAINVSDRVRANLTAGV